MRRFQQRFGSNSHAHWALICLSLIWAYVVLRSGAVSTHDWHLSVLALGALALSSALLLSPAQDTPSLGASLRWTLLLLPCYVALQTIPIPFKLVRVLSP